MDRNLLHISYEAGILEDPWFDPTTKANKGMFKLSVSPEDAPNKAEYVELDFVQGNCTAVNGKKLSPGRRAQGRSTNWAASTASVVLISSRIVSSA